MFKKGFVARLATTDAITDGKAAAYIFHISTVHIRETSEGVIVKVNNEEFVKGNASAFGANTCLIHTLQQCIEHVVGVTNVNVAAVRLGLQEEFADNLPSQVTAKKTLRSICTGML